MGKAATKKRACVGQPMSGAIHPGPPTVPSVVGTHGVGRRPDGQRVFFDGCVAPYGSWGEQTLVASQELLEVADGVDDAVAAALGTAGLAAWLALDWRARLRPGQTVLVLGATGALGSVAVQVAAILGAARVVAAARPGRRLDRLRDQGADAVVALGDLTTDRAVADLSQEFIAATGWADVIVDPLWGRPALAAMKAAAPGARPQPPAKDVVAPAQPQVVGRHRILGKHLPVLLGDEVVTFDGWGSRRHTWGVNDWWAGDASVGDASAGADELGGGIGHRTGSRTVKAEPTPSVLSAWMSPPMMRQNSLLMERPSPVPP